MKPARMTVSAIAAGAAAVPAGGIDASWLETQPVAGVTMAGAFAGNININADPSTAPAGPRWRSWPATLAAPTFIRNTYRGIA